MTDVLSPPLHQSGQETKWNFSPIEFTLSCHLFSTIRGSLSFFLYPYPTAAVAETQANRRK